MSRSIWHIIRQSCVIKVLIVLVLFLSLAVLQQVYVHGINGFSSRQNSKEVSKSPSKGTTYAVPRKVAAPARPEKRTTPGANAMVEQMALFRDLYAQENWPEISRPEKVTPEKRNPSKTTDDSKSAEGLPLYRDIYAQQAWPEITRHTRLAPDKLPNTVHYIWCGKKREFRFQHYLGILSIIRLLQPLKLVFHYTHLPVLDEKWYHVWFWELKQSYASLELRQLKTAENSCDPKVLASAGLDFLAENGEYMLPQHRCDSLSRSHYARITLVHWLTRFAWNCVCSQGL